MSAVPEIIALKELGVPVLAVAVVTNLAAGLSATPLTQEEVAAAVNAAGGEVAAAITKVVEAATLKDFPVPALAGNAFNVVPPAEVFAEIPAIEAAIDALLPGQAVDALVVLGGKHALAGFAPVGEVPLAKLEGFPIGQYVKAVLRGGDRWARTADIRCRKRR
jgi:hypothetical protein